MYVAAFRRDCQTDKYLRTLLIGPTVVKLGNVALPDDTTECLKGPRHFGNRHAENRFATLTNVCALRDIPESIKVCVSATQDSHD